MMIKTSFFLGKIILIQTYNRSIDPKYKLLKIINDAP